jgi:hypothetical protein
VFEAAIASVLLLYLILLGALGVEWQFLAGAGLALTGLVGGGGAGIVYHLALRRALARLGASTRGWLWSPVSCHRLLDEQGRVEVLPWFRLGAAGFFVCLAGIGMVAVALVKAMFAR